MGEFVHELDDAIADHPVIPKWAREETHQGHPDKEEKGETKVDTPNVPKTATVQWREAHRDLATAVQAWLEKGPGVETKLQGTLLYKEGDEGLVMGEDFQFDAYIILWKRNRISTTMPRKMWPDELERVPGTGTPQPPEQDPTIYAQPPEPGSSSPNSMRV